METRDRKHLKSVGKSLLSDQEYLRFSSALKTFSKTKNVEILSKELRFIAGFKGKTELLRLTGQMLPKNKRDVFMGIFRDTFADANFKTSTMLEEGKENHDPGHISSNKTRSSNKVTVIIMERTSYGVDFGFRIRGDLFTKQEIVTGQVDRHSIAERSGLKEGHRIVSINGTNCGRARKADVIQLVKSSERLYLKVICSSQGVKNLTKSTLRQQQEGNTSKHVTVSSDEDGWLGCSIRGYVNQYVNQY